MLFIENIEIWREARNKRVVGEPAPKDVLIGPGYLYRPEQLLVNTADLHLIQDLLDRVKAQRHDEMSGELEQYGLPLAVFEVRGVPIPTLVSRLRAVRSEGSPVPRVGPNHVFFGEPVYMGSPADEPRPASAPVRSWDEVEGDGPTVAALDTGIPSDLRDLHPDLQGRMVTEGDDVDVLYSSGDLLDHEGGHGTFVSGILMQLAPWLRINPEKVLDPGGVGDDRTVTLGLAKAKCSLANASLGGYTHDDMPPPGLQAFLDRRDPESVVVAAAGNNSQDRPFWPAAFKHVIAVGAVDNRKGQLSPAKFTNFGDWVDCCAPGVGVLSTYVKGQWELTAPGESGVEQLDGWARWSGTSFAAPHVTATIAARMRAEPALTPRQAAHAVLLDATTYVPGLGFFITPPGDLVS